MGGIPPIRFRITVYVLMPGMIHLYKRKAVSPRVTSRLGARWIESSDIPKEIVKWRNRELEYVL